MFSPPGWSDRPGQGTSMGEGQSAAGILLGRESRFHCSTPLPGIHKCSLISTPENQYKVLQPLLPSMADICYFAYLTSKFLKKPQNFTYLPQFTLFENTGECREHLSSPAEEIYLQNDNLDFNTALNYLEIRGFTSHASVHREVQYGPTSQRIKCKPTECKGHLRV